MMKLKTKASVTIIIALALGVLAIGGSVLQANNKVVVKPCTTQELAEDSCGGRHVNADEPCDAEAVGYKTCEKDDDCNFVPDIACKEITRTCGLNHYTQKLCVHIQSNLPYYNLKN